MTNAEETTPPEKVEFETEPIGVIESRWGRAAIEALTRIEQAITAQGGVFVQRETNDTWRSYNQKLLDRLEAVEVAEDDHELALDIEVASAYLRHRPDPSEAHGAGDEHPQVRVDGLPFTVDEDIVPLIRALWEREYRTIGSCQADPYAGGWTSVTFIVPSDAQRLIAICVKAAAAWEDYEFFGRVSGDNLRGGKYWGERVWVSDGRIATHTLFSSGSPGLHPFLVTIQMHPDDVELVVRALEEFGEYVPQKFENPYMS